MKKEKGNRKRSRKTVRGEEGDYRVPVEVDGRVDLTSSIVLEALRSAASEVIVSCQSSS